MKKLVLTLASTAMLAGFGAAYANGPTPLTAGTMDKITAGGGGESNCGCDKKSGEHTYQRNSSFLSPQVNAVAVNANVSPNVSVINVGQNDQQTETQQSNSQSNFNGNISR